MRHREARSNVQERSYKAPELVWGEKSKPHDLWTCVRQGWNTVEDRENEDPY